MKNLIGLYAGVIPTMCNTPCKIAIFNDGNEIKVFQKEFFRNNLNRPNWSINVNFKKYKNTKQIEEKLLSANFTKIM